MSTSTPEAQKPAGATETPAPIQEVEKKIEDVAPAALKPEAEVLAKEANAELADASAKGVVAGAEAAKTDPGVAAAAQTVDKLFSGEAVAPGQLLSVGSGVVKEVKAGYKTTEFWGALALIVLTQVGALHIPGKYGDTITTTATASAYIVSRGLAKFGANRA